MGQRWFSAVRVVMPASVTDRLVVQGILTKRKFAGEVAARLDALFKSDRSVGGLPPALAVRLGYYWGVDTRRSPDVDREISTTVWMPDILKEKVEREALRRNEAVGRAAGRLIEQSLNLKMPSKITALVTELDAILPEDAPFRAPLPPDAVELVLKVRDEIVKHQKPFRYRLGCKAGCKAGRVGR